MPGSRDPNAYHPFWRSLAYWIFVTLAMLVAFFIVRKLTLCWTLTHLPGIPPAECAIPTNGTSDLPASPDPTDSNPLLIEPSIPKLELPKWDGASRINIVFFGLRGGEQDGCSNCTDTIMVLMADPVAKTAGM